MVRVALTRLRYRVGAALRALRSSSSSSSVISEAEAREWFGEWCKKHGRTYSSEEEKVFRFIIFKEQLEKRALKTPEGVPVFNGNCISDQTIREVRRHYCWGRSPTLLYRVVTFVEKLFKKK